MSQTANAKEFLRNCSEDVDIDVGNLSPVVESDLRMAIRNNLAGIKITKGVHYAFGGEDPHITFEFQNRTWHAYLNNNRDGVDRIDGSGFFKNF